MSSQTDITLLPGVELQQNVTLAPLTTLQIGGPARYYAVPNSVEDVVTIYDYARRVGLPVYILGNGSNLLIDDVGLDGITLHLGSGFAYYRHTVEQITVGGGLTMPRLARLAVELGSAGFEWMVGVPGTVGAGVAINAGAGQQSMRDNLVSVTHMNPKGEIVTDPAANVELRHRGSRLLDQGHVILEATFHLDHSQPTQTVNDKTQEFVTKRRKKFPLRYPNCGSVFKRPSEGKGQFAGQLIESVGLKGLRSGQAQVSEIHANFIINLGRASSEDVKHLINQMQEQVFQKHGILLEREVRYFPQDVCPP